MNNIVFFLSIWEKNSRTLLDLLHEENQLFFYICELLSSLLYKIMYKWKWFFLLLTKKLQHKIKIEWESNVILTIFNSINIKGKSTFSLTDNSYIFPHSNVPKSLWICNWFELTSNSNNTMRNWPFWENMHNSQLSFSDSIKQLTGMTKLNRLN